MPDKNPLAPLEREHNFRDLGGLRTGGGRRVHAGRLFRSGHWGKFTDDELGLVAVHGIERVIDFRIAEEVSANPDRLPAGARHVHLPIEGTGVPIGEVNAAIIAGEPDRIAPDYLQSANRSYVLDHVSEYRAFMRHVLDSDGRPLAFHCTAGKDRAGLAAALLLSALGVERDEIWRDYLRSNVARVELNAAMMRDFIVNVTAKFGAERARRMDLRAIENLLVVRREYLQAAWDAIDDHYGGVDAYLREGLSLGGGDIDALRGRYLA